MGKFWWPAAWGLCLVHLSLAQTQIDLNITCRYAGVFHVEKNGRYSISRTEAADLCKAFNSTLPTMAQMQQALKKGFETCRYGFIEGYVVIPRITPNAICAANNTGVYVLTSNNSHYDTYCFNASAPLEEDCTSVTDLPSSFEGPVTITIVNRDGTRYSKKGEYRTNPADINSTNPLDDDVSSGSPNERSTSGGYIFRTNISTAHPTQDHTSTMVYKSIMPTLASTGHSNSHATVQEQNHWTWFGLDNSKLKTPETTTMVTTGTESNTISTGWEPNEENEDETDTYLSFSGSGIDDDEDFTASTNIDRNSTTVHGENGTQELQLPVIHHEHRDEEEMPHSTSTTWAIPSSTTEETATQKEQFGIGIEQPGKYPQTSREDSHVTAGTTVTTGSASQRMTTQGQEDVSLTDSVESTSHFMGQGHATENTDTDSSLSATPQPTAGPSTDLAEDLDTTGPFSVATQQSHFQNFSTTQGETEEDKDHPTTISILPPSTRSDDKDGRRGTSLPENATSSLEEYTSSYPDTKGNETLISVTPTETGDFGETEVTVATESTFNVDVSLPGGVDPSKSSHITRGSETSGHSSENQEGEATTTSGPIRKARIPEWLIILASLLALALILAVCIAVNSRRRCGQKKKLVINSGNGAVEGRKPSELNGDASKSQEMVHLVNKEPSDTPDQCMTADETRNLQNVDMKIGV